jgi:hypothetical protein
VLVLVPPHRLLEHRNPFEVAAARHLPQRHTLGQLHLAGDIDDGRDHDRLRLLGHESCRAQPLRQVIGPIVRMRFPLEPLATLSEDVHLSRDHLVEVRTLEPAEVAIDDKATARPAEEAQ